MSWRKGSSVTPVFRAGNYASGAVDPANGAVVKICMNKDSASPNGCAPAGLTANRDTLYTGGKDGGIPPQ